MLDKIQSDLKAALLSGDKETVETLKNVKSAVQYEAVAKKLDRDNVSDEVVQLVLTKEAKKRQEAADLYKNAGETARADKELKEKQIISKYLPEQISEQELQKIVNEELSKFESPSPKDLGQIIGNVKAKTAGQADGALIAKLVRQGLGLN